MGSVMTVIALIVTVAFAGFVLYICREEYGIARSEGRGRVRGFLRAIRVTFDSFVMGH